MEITRVCPGPSGIRPLLVQKGDVAEFGITHVICGVAVDNGDCASALLATEFCLVARPGQIKNTDVLITIVRTKTLLVFMELLLTLDWMRSRFVPYSDRNGNKAALQ